MSESILSVLQCDGDEGRVVLVHRQSHGKSEMLLRRESFSEDVGWFEQSSVELSTGQLGQLKQALGVLPSSKASRTTGLQGHWGTATNASAGKGQAATGRTPRFGLVSQIAG